MAVFLSAVLISFCTGQDPAKVTASGRQILLDGNPYIIKGICYHPVPKGSDKRTFESLDMDLALRTEAGINTIRVR